MWKELGTKTLYITLIGYATLISYTGPMGFIPVVAVQSLPILLVGFSLVLIMVFIGLGVLFLPFWFYTEKNIRRYLIYQGIEEYKNKPINVPIGNLFINQAKKLRLLVIPFFILNLSIPLLFCFFVWYSLSLGLENRIVLAPLAIAMYVGFRSLVGAAKAKSIKESARYLAGIGIVFILLPSLSLPPANKQISSLFVPNSLVEDALRITALGGGISVKAEKSSEQRVTQPITGHLLFYDGQTMWLTPCGVSDVIRMQLEVKYVAYYSRDVCAK